MVIYFPFIIQKYSGVVTQKHVIKLRYNMGKYISLILQIQSFIQVQNIKMRKEKRKKNH